MAQNTSTNNRPTVFKRTSQSTLKPKTSSMNKSKKLSFKRYKGQGK